MDFLPKMSLSISISISIFSKMTLSISISISIFSRMSLSISISISIFLWMSLSISIFSRVTLSISISIFSKCVDISIIDMAYRYISNTPIRQWKVPEFSKIIDQGQGNHGMQKLGSKHTGETVSQEGRAGRHWTEESHLPLSGDQKQLAFVGEKAGAEQPVTVAERAAPVLHSSLHTYTLTTTCPIH